MTGTKIQLADAPPAADHLTEYDRNHLKTYARLLDADAARADWQEVADLVLGLDVTRQAEHARRVYRAHLERARWMAKAGYQHLLPNARAG